MTAHRKPCFPPTYDEYSPPGTCRWCAETEGMPVKKDGTPHGRIRYHPACKRLLIEMFPTHWWANTSVAKRDGKVCKACGVPECGPLELDHVVPLWSVDRSHPEAWKYFTFANLQLLGQPCHKKKSAIEAAQRAKEKRLRGETCNGRRQKISSRPFPKTPRKLASRPLREAWA